MAARLLTVAFMGASITALHVLNYGKTRFRAVMAVTEMAI
jgi:hypothetical protein